MKKKQRNRENYFSGEGDKNVLKLDSGDSFKTLWVYWKPLTHTLWKGEFMVCELYLSKADVSIYLYLYLCTYMSICLSVSMYLW